MTDSGSRWHKWGVCALLAVTVLAVFGQSLRCTFTDFDDGEYVTFNPVVQQGLTGQGFRWAFTTNHAANWHPLTWLSHMMDCQLYGLNPIGHHLTSVLLHTANAVLLLLLLNRLTGALWPSAWVAAIFALHPLRVESVVWVSERKDVLSAFFWMLTVGAYVRYAEEFKVQSSRFKVCYTAALVFFAFALMAKPMAVTLPFVLLLLDYWPLGRLRLGPGFSWRPILEKIPFFLLAVSDSVVTFLVQHHAGAMKTLAKYPFSLRVANAPVAYMRYIGKIFWPSGLAVFYPHRPLGWAEVSGALCLLGVVTIWVVRRWREQPYLAVGWFWFLGMLVPTLGLVQAGDQSMADRFTYLSSVGLCIMVAWGVRDWIGDRPWARTWAEWGGGAAVVGCLVLTPAQIFYWHDSDSLFMRAIRVADKDSKGPVSYIAYYNLGCSASDKGQDAQAIAYFNKALSAEKDNALWADHSQAYNNLGYVYLRLGQISNAVANLEKAVLLRPRYPEAYYNMGRAFLANGQPDVAVDGFQHAAALDRNPVILGALAGAYAQEGKLSEAVNAAQEARQLALAQNNHTLVGTLEAQLRQYQAGHGGLHP